MFDVKTLHKAIDQIAEEKNIDKQKVWEAVEDAVAAAYKREYEKRGEIVRAQLNTKTGDVRFWQVKTVVDETTADMTQSADSETIGQPQTELAKIQAEEALRRKEKEEREAEGSDEIKLPRYNRDRHLLLEEAREIKKDAHVGDEITFPLESHDDFGRIAAQTAKQVILQKIREAERSSIISEYLDKEGDIVTGTVQRFERGNVYIDLGRATGVMFHNESIPGEHYKSGDRMRFFVLAVQEDAKMPGIVLSRAHPKFVSRLFAIEVPEIADGTIDIKAIAREAGSRTKFAVTSNADGIDPVGSCVGQRGTRVMAVSNELRQEKLDIIEWSEDPATFIGNSLSPAKVRRVEILPRREALVYVGEDQLSLAIGKGGQNVRLAHKITGWKIDVRSEENPDQTPEGGSAGIVEEAMPEVQEEAGEKSETKSEE